MKLPNIFKRKRSIARRLTWRVILTVTLVFVIISTFIFGIIWFVGSAALLAYTTKGMDVTNEKISNVFTNIEVAVNNNKAVVEDVHVLLGVLRKLVDRGNTVIIIEHNLDVIRACDWLIDLGPEGGRDGGQVVAVGTIEDIKKCPKSITGKYL